MKKILKKYGNSNIILITPEEMEIYGLEQGNVVDFEMKKEFIQNKQ